MLLYRHLELSIHRKRWKKFKILCFDCIEPQTIQMSQYSGTNFNIDSLRVQSKHYTICNLILNRFLFFYFIIYIWLERQVSAACLSVVIGTINFNKSDRSRELANRLVHLSLSFVFIATFCQIIQMNFGLDPAIQLNEDTKF